VRLAGRRSVGQVWSDARVDSGLGARIDARICADDRHHGVRVPAGR
jgi:hypothetical protein